MGFTKDKLLSDKFRSVYTLFKDSKSEDENLRMLQRKLIMIAVIVYFLATETTFFGKKFEEDWKILMKEDDILFIADVIFIMISTEALETIFVYNNVENKTSSLQIYPVMSLLNPSCNPNAIKTVESDGYKLYSIFPIKKGQEIFVPYISDLFVGFNSVCKCFTCKNNITPKKKLKMCKDLVKNARTINIITNQICKIQKYIDNPETMKAENKSLVIKRLRNTMEVLCKYVKGPCVEIEDLRHLMATLLGSKL